MVLTWDNIQAASFYSFVNFAICSSSITIFRRSAISKLGTNNKLLASVKYNQSIEYYDENKMTVYREIRDCPDSNLYPSISLSCSNFGKCLRVRYWCIFSFYRHERIINHWNRVYYTHLYCFSDTASSFNMFDVYVIAFFRSNYANSHGYLKYVSALFIPYYEYSNKKLTQIRSLKIGLSRTPSSSSRRTVSRRHKI